MSPVPVIELQRRLTLVGSIRAGGEKGERAPGRKLETWRITSARPELLEQAAGLYGGEPTPWKGPNGDEYQLYTTAAELPVLAMPGYSLRQRYELWDGPAKRLRLCDGVEEELSGGPCLCNTEGADRCDLYSRLVVALPELETALGWRVITKGLNAAHELPTMMALIDARAAGQTFVPARLRLDQRRGTKDGQVVRFVVPVLDLGVGYATLGGPRQPALPEAQRAPAGFTPAPSRPEQPDIEQVLASATETPKQSTRRNRAPEIIGFGADLDDDFGAPPVVLEGEALPPIEEPRLDAPPAPEEPAQIATERQSRHATEPQKKKLNVLVGRLRRGGHIETGHLWLAVAQMRGLETFAMVDLIAGAKDDDGTLHWAPLRETLYRQEASDLIERLQAHEQRLGLTPADPVAYNEFPDEF